MNRSFSGFRNLASFSSAPHALPVSSAPLSCHAHTTHPTVILDPPPAAKPRSRTPNPPETRVLPFPPSIQCPRLRCPRAPPPARPAPLRPPAAVLGGWPISRCKPRRIPAVVRAKSKGEASFTDRILDYIEGGPKLRRWYGAPDLLPKDRGAEDEEDEPLDIEEPRDAVLVTNGDSEIGQDGFFSDLIDLKGVQHIVLLSQLVVYRNSGGIQAILNGKLKKLAERDEEVVLASGIPSTIIRSGSLQSTPGGVRGFDFTEGVAAKGRISREDAATICVEALDAIPQNTLIFEVANGDKKVEDWKAWFSEQIQRNE
ncbi:hypothetical protein PR202_gn00266 [Eleusine coracana subsp. coracana]|uniref:NAD(P)-binding domain-containing protein n=1 Tax=Eleusine coracana subsp. coracana TaxID=191504 RepID=A0AAV5G1H4_ELECO|nr:hypothetical protein PR202_gn00161 [Eleusine coracana subsp. coracana]GJN40953.1 hypothetical protein PR202_gn00266 [Eleusine coracana subsp. coracana]